MDIYSPNSPSTVAAAIAALRGLDLRTANIDEIKKQLGLISRGWVTTGYTFHPSPDSLLTRARICEKLPEHLSEIGAPSPEMVSTFGRANFPGQSIFYASAGRQMPFFEVAARTGDKIALSVWEIAKPLTLLPIGYTPEVFEQSSSSREVPFQLASILSMPYVHRFLSEHFCRVINNRNSHEYKISATFAQMAYQSTGLHGVLYPSLAMRANGDNMALRRDVISNGTIKLRWLEWVEITECHDMRYSIKTLLHSERFEHGRIYWDEIQPVSLQPGEKMRISVKNGRYRFERTDELPRN